MLPQASLRPVASQLRLACLRPGGITSTSMAFCIRQGHRVVLTHSWRPLRSFEASQIVIVADYYNFMLQ